MPTLNWIGKEKVINHHQDVPYRVLEHKYGFIADASMGSATSTGSATGQNKETQSGNKIIHGDNLEALKSLLPEYEGKIKCIYIDPPYNTGNEKWVYNDNVNHPKIKKWLGEVVGKDGEDLSRHDKWLCMMYPRIQLSHKLLKDDGIIAIHIDENEYHNLVIVFEEIFGKKNNLGTIIWNKKNPKGDATKISYQHESIIVFSKNAELVKGKIRRKKKNAQKIIEFSKKVFAKIGKTSYPEDILQICKKYKLDKSLFDKYKFNYNLETVNAEFAQWINSQDFSGGEKAYKFIDKDGEVYRGVSMAWPNKKQAPDEYFIPLIHPITKNECPIPARGWRNPPSTMKELLDKNMILFGNDETKQPERKYFLKENMLENISSLIGFAGSDDEFQKKIGINLENPKPYLLSTEIVDWFSDKDSIILDSFAGSGTTAHAVLNLNKQDGGNRKFILIEMEDYANDITAERVKRVMQGYGASTTSTGSAAGAAGAAGVAGVAGGSATEPKIEGTGGAFDFYELGLPLFNEDKNLNEEVGLPKIREYIWFSETRTSTSLSNHTSASLSNHTSASLSNHTSASLSNHTSASLSNHTSASLSNHTSASLSNHTSASLSNHTSASLSNHTSAAESNAEKYLLGKKDDSVYYFIYEKDSLTTLDYDALELIKTKGEQYIIYADNCLLPKDFMARKNIIFKKIPRDITRF